MTTELTTRERVEILSTMTTRDDASRHFTERYEDSVISELESAGLIEIDRPVHDATGLRYSEEYWTLEVTPEGVELVEAFPEYHPIVG